ncbi:MAG: nuclear transport factor 2 family protein [Pseudomonadales bacterium]|nr:nuclear transport factor 2 family protein [Pseudomonadales bacterium]
MIRKKAFPACYGFLAAFLLLAACGESPQQTVAPAAAVVDPDSQLVALQTRLADLQRRAERIRDANAIKRLQRAYGYYLDEALWDEVVDLFADDASLEIGLDGVYRGKDRIRAYFYQLGGGHQGLMPGQLNEHMQLMPVVTLAADGMSARGRWRDLILAGQYGESATWGEGPFENEYVKEDGIWKISKLHWYQTIVVPYKGGWAANEDVNKGIYVSAQLPPDAPPSVPYEPWPETFLPPFHFPNPVLSRYARLHEEGQQP